MEKFKNFPRKRLLNIVVLMAVLLGIFGAPRPVSAANIVVNTLADEFGTNPAACSLREAIYTANTDKSFGGCLSTVGGEDTIFLGPGTYVLSLGTTNEVADAVDDTGAIGDLDIYSPMHIVGAGANSTIIRPVNGSKTRVIHISVLNANVIIQDVTVTNGYAYWNNPNPAEPLYEELGGGIFNEYGRLTLWRTTVAINKAHHSGGGVYSNRESRNSLYILDSTINHNLAEMGDGGGIVNESAMVIAKSLVWKNVVGYGNGGGIYNNSAGRLSAVTVAENEVHTANGRGSGIYADTVIEIFNSTIVRNVSYARDRYGIEIFAGEAVLMNNIIAFNESFTGGTYVPANCLFNPSVMGTSNFRDVDELVVVDGKEKQICSGQGSDFMKTSASIHLSETLEYNQGLAKSYTLLPNSALIDGGKNSFKHMMTGYNYVCSGSDQRWGLIPNDGNGDGQFVCDVGAVEYPHPTNGLYSRKKLYLPNIGR